MSATHPEVYTPGHSGRSVAMMARRGAATHAAFFTPLLQPGMSLLDCGCGPGTITVDLARIVRPGSVLGLDASGIQFEAARATAAAEGLSVRLEAGNIYALPLPDNSVDAVFSHALFEHLREPARAAAEIWRVLKPGGVAGLRSPDWGGFLIYPYPEPVARAIEVYQALVRSNGGDVHVGRKHAAQLRAAGFARVQPSASYEVYPDPALIAEYLAAQLDARDAPAAAALRAWCRDPDALFMQAWGEAVAFKP